MSVTHVMKSCLTGKLKLYMNILILSRKYSTWMSKTEPCSQSKLKGLRKHFVRVTYVTD